MSGFTLGTFVKAAGIAAAAAIAAATAAAGGPDLSGLDIGSWLASIGTGLIAGGAAFTDPHKTDEVNERSAATVKDVADTAAEAHDKLTKQAIDSIKKVQEAVGGLAGSIPALPSYVPPPPSYQSLPPLSTQVISSWQQPQQPQQPQPPQPQPTQEVATGSLASQVIDLFPKAK